MTTFAQRCGLADAARDAAIERVAKAIAASGTELVRFAWCDVHGFTRGKALVPAAALRAMHEGVGMVSTLLLKDSSDRTAFPVFERGGTADLPGFGFANNLLLLPDPDSFRELPWAPRTAWLRCQPWFEDGTPVPFDTRRILQHALARLQQAGFALRCGLEVEFHIWRIADATAAEDPAQAGWPGLPPQLRMIHPGYQLLGENWLDLADEPLRIVRQTAQDLGLPLASVEVEFGPSQVEAVFEPVDALAAADHMVLFRMAMKQALRRAGYHASFVCRPPFPNIMASGWHLHQSVVDARTGANLFRCQAPPPGSTPADAAHSLSAVGGHWLAGLLEHARATTVFCTPTINGFGRFRPNALAPQSVLWGRDNRGAMLRVIGQRGDDATRIENRIGEPAANPYLYIASQIHAGLDGVERRLQPPPATDAPYGSGAPKLPASLPEALQGLQDDAPLRQAFGQPVVDWFSRIKQAEWRRWEQASDKDDFQRREYFSRL